MKRILVIILCLFAAVRAFSQQQYSVWENLLADIVDADEYSEAELSDIREHLWELESHPLNINDATYDDFASIPGLSLDQISDIMYYRDKYGELQSMEELALVSSVGREMRLLLGCFFVAKPTARKKWYERPALDSLLRRGTGVVTATASLPLYERKGNGGSYLGNKYRYGVKVKGQFAGHIKYALAGSKDFGEPVFNNLNRYGMDDYGFFVSVKELGCIENATLGRFRMRLGMGLTLNNGFTLGKQFSLSSLGNDAGTASSGYSSRSDSHYLQGATATLGLFGGSVKVTGFVSYRYLDATLNDDGSVATILASPYHRTESELAKRNNTAETMGGGHVAWKQNGWHLGVSGVLTRYDRVLTPSLTQEYKRYYARGRDFWNASADYGYVSHRLTLSGETATGDCGAVATLNMLSVLLGSDVRITAVQRYYAYQYYALLANSFSEGGAVKNESGVYVGIELPVAKRVRLSAYTDYAYFPWARYMTSRSSHSWDNKVELNCDGRTTTWKISYRYRLRQKDNEAGTAMLPMQEHSVRLALGGQWGWLTVKPQIDFRCHNFDGQTSNGVAGGVGMRCSPAEKATLSLSLGCFFTDDYNSRMYVYQYGLPESFSYFMYYGKGIYGAFVARYNVNARLMLIGRIGYAGYFDRDTISSGDQMISHPYKTDVDVQVRWKF